jgi:hypothetical protein
MNEGQKKYSTKEGFTGFASSNRECPRGGAERYIRICDEEKMMLSIGVLMRQEARLSTGVITNILYNEPSYSSCSGFLLLQVDDLDFRL